MRAIPAPNARKYKTDQVGEHLSKRTDKAQCGHVSQMYFDTARCPPDQHHHNGGQQQEHHTEEYRTTSAFGFIK
jgi:hypothetical protein